jgi:hypothetical protein
MARIFAPIVPPSDPRECAPWLNRELRRISMTLQQGQRGMAAIARGEAPDASGTPLTDLSGVFLLAGRVTDQIGAGGTRAGGSLTLTSTSSPTKGFIYLGRSGTTLGRMAYDETNVRLGLGSETPAAKLEIKQPGTTLGVQPNATNASTNSNWIGDNGDTGATRYTRVNELTADDATNVNDQTILGNTFAVDLPAVTPQATTATITIRARCRWNGTSAGSVGVQVTLQLKDGNGTSIHLTGANQLAAPSFSGDTGYVEFSFTLTPTEIGNIANWTGMTILVATGGGGTGYSGTNYISWIQFQVVGATAVDLVALYDTNGTKIGGFTSAAALYFITGAGSGKWMKSDAGGVASWASPAALTKTDDTNVTLTLGGSASTALLNAASLTLGWTGQLSIARGGTGQSTASAAFDALAPTTTRGDLIVRGASSNVRLGIGAAGTVLSSDGTDPSWVATTALTASFKDNLFTVVDDGDTTKKLAFQCSGITTGTTRTLTVPDVSGTILTSGTITVTGMNLLLKGGTSLVPLTIQQRTGIDHSDLLDIKNSGATIIFSVDYLGQIIGRALTLDVTGTGLIAPAISITNGTDSTGLAVNHIPSGGGVFYFLPFPASITESLYVTTWGNAVDLTAQTASIAATTLRTPTVTGMWRVVVEASCSTAGAAGTVQVTIKWTQGGVAKSKVILGTALSLTSTANADGEEAIIYADVSTNITYETNLAGGSGTPKYDLHIRLEYLDI